MSTQLSLLDTEAWPSASDLAELDARVTDWTAQRAIESDLACIAHDVADEDLLAWLPRAWEYDTCRRCGDRVYALMRAESKARRR